MRVSELVSSVPDAGARVFLLRDQIVAVLSSHDCALPGRHPQTIRSEVVPLPVKFVAWLRDAEGVMLPGDAVPSTLRQGRRRDGDGDSDSDDTRARIRTLSSSLHARSRRSRGMRL